MSARKFRNTWWVDFRFRRERHRIRSPENTKAGAEAYEALVRQRLARGEPSTGYKKEQIVLAPYLTEFADKWFRTYVQTNNKPSEQKAKQVALRKHLIPFFKKYRLNQITKVYLEEYKSAKLKTGLSPKTINNHLSILAKCLHTAKEWSVITDVPGIKFLKVPPQRFDFLIPEESQRLLNSIKDKNWYAMILVALRTGLRLGELLGLQWEDINLDTNQLTVRHSIVRGIVSSPKNNKIRYIPFTDEVKGALLELKPGKGLVFYRTTGYAMNHETPRLNLMKMCQVAGLRQIGWHTLRHTFASQLVAVGASLKAVQDLLGHSDIRTTMRYSHLAPSALRETVALLDRPKNPESENFGQQAVNVAGLISTLKKKRTVMTAFSNQQSMVAGVGIEPTT